MFNAILAVQWKWSRSVLIPLAVFAFAIPLLSAQSTTPPAEGYPDTRYGYTLAHHVLDSMENWSVLYTLLAAGVGLALAVTAWRADHRGRHIYALTLPIQRARLVWYRFAAGAAFLLVPVLALLAGALVTSVSMTIPDGLQAYPIALTIRFALASLVAYALFFSISSATQKTALIVLAPLALLVVTDVLLTAGGVRANLVERAADLVFGLPGVMEVFTGRWLLIDV